MLFHPSLPMLGMPFPNLASLANAYSFIILILSIPLEFLLIQMMMIFLSCATIVLRVPPY